MGHSVGLAQKMWEYNGIKYSVGFHVFVIYISLQRFIVRQALLTGQFTLGKDS